jgi:hypothetical protein
MLTDLTKSRIIPEAVLFPIAKNSKTMRRLVPCLSLNKTQTTLATGRMVAQ